MDITGVHSTDLDGTARERDPVVRIDVGPQGSASLGEGAEREWLVPDGTGGFAMGTVCGLRTRRYHALLVAADGTPARRRVGLAALDPVLVLPSGARVPLGTHEWASGAVAPQGYRHLEGFRLVDGLPHWRYRVGDVVLQRTVATRHGTPSVAVVHRLLSGGPLRLELHALCTWRDAHAERHAERLSGGGGLRPLDVEHLPDGAVVESAYRLAGPDWRPAGEWYLGAHTREEAARGLPAEEDLWFAGHFECTLQAGDTAEVSAWAGDLGTRPPRGLDVVAAARRRARAVVRAAGATDATEATLALAADAFVVTGPDVVAGYPWFGTWSRDTMTAYEGLFLETGRADEGRALLRRYAETVSAGMLANTADTGVTQYNTSDATLWFMSAVGRHLARTGDVDLAGTLASALDDVVEAHVGGTRYGIVVDPRDGLLTQGAPGFALTWMDARIDGVGATPRIGKAVEVNALWLDALAAARSVRQALGKDDTDLEHLQARARSSFTRRFPAPGGALYDVLDGPQGNEDTLRPNQLLALSLPGAGVADALPAGSILDQVGAGLLTPLGLRSLAPDAVGYRGAHRGGPAERDGAYHQGTVWPWLVGPYVDALLRNGRPVDGVLDGLVGHLREWGVGSVSETADGDAPHAATGCPFQAWSVAELLRACRAVGAAGAVRAAGIGLVLP